VLYGPFLVFFVAFLVRAAVGDFKKKITSLYSSGVYAPFTSLFLFMSLFEEEGQSEWYDAFEEEGQSEWYDVTVPYDVASSAVM